MNMFSILSVKCWGMALPVHMVTLCLTWGITARVSQSSCAPALAHHYTPPGTAWRAQESPVTSVRWFAVTAFPRWLMMPHIFSCACLFCLGECLFRPVAHFSKSGHVSYVLRVLYVFWIQYLSNTQFEKFFPPYSIGRLSGKHKSCSFGCCSTLKGLSHSSVWDFMSWFCIFQHTKHFFFEVSIQ